MNEYAVEAEELVKDYGKVRALDGVSFKIRRGEVFTFLGPNGAGKTTTVEILQCLRPLTSGRAFVLGFDVSRRGDAEEIKKRIGVMPQDFRGVEGLTVLENVKLFAELYEKAADLRGLLEQLGLWERRNQLFKKLSGGLKQRVGLAAALVNDPELIFLDEPTTGLDPTARREVWEIIKNLKKQGKTIILTTHYMEEAEELADNIAIINRGRIIAEGSPAELTSRYGGEKKLMLKLPEKNRETLSENGIEYTIENGWVVVRIGDMREVARVIEKIGARTTIEDMRIKHPRMEDVFLNLLGARITEEGELA